MADTNPNGANQWVADPRQQLFLQSYLNPKSSTFSNALQSGLKAGYSKEYSENITNQMPSWLAENLGTASRVTKALDNLNNALHGTLDDPEKGAKTIQYKATELVLKTHMKDDFSERQEHTGKDGERLVFLPQELMDKHDLNKE